MMGPMAEAPVFDVRPCSRDDLGAVVGLLNACDVEELGEPDTSEDDIAAGWDESAFDLAADAWVAVGPGGGIVGYAELWCRGEPDDLDLGLYEHPHHHGSGIAGSLLDRALARAAERARAHPSGTVRVGTWSAHGSPLRPLLQTVGFDPVRLFFRMRADLGDEPVPPSPPFERVELRAMRPGIDERAVHAALVEAFADHVRPVPADFDTFAERHLRHPDFDPSLWTVAWDGPAVAGAIMVFDHGDLAFVRDVGVRRQWRGIGVGMALLVHTFRLLQQRGQRRLDLGVDADDPVGATRLYERAGFRIVQRSDLLELVVDGQWRTFVASF